LDRGTVNIVKVIAKYIQKKGVNAVHLSKELLAEELLTHHDVGNISRPRFHGLVAKVSENAGNYCLTNKGLDFLNGKQVESIALIKKATDKVPAYTIGYIGEPVTIKDFDNEWGEWWSASGYEIQEGRVITQPKGKLF